MTMNQVKHLHRQAYEGIPAHWVTDWLLYVLQKSPSFLITDGDYQLTEVELAQFETGIAQMQSGTPLAYLTGKQAFWSLEFEVNEHTLIPRPDTEVLVERVLGWIDKHTQTDDTNNSPQRLLDLGTGSGCIAISLAHELQTLAPNRWQVTAIDYSKPALEVAKRNANLNDVTNIEFKQSDWFVVLKDSEGTTDKSADKPMFEVIVSNPPYIVDNDEHLDKLKAEPLSALVAPDNGLGDIKQIAEHARGYLVSGGLLAIEHGFDQGELVRQIFTDFGYTQVETLQDYGGNDRVTWGVYT